MSGQSSTQIDEKPLTNTNDGLNKNEKKNNGYLN